MAAVDELLADARARIEPRVQPQDLDTERRAGTLIVDMRTTAQRAADGELPGAILVERNVLEWRLDPDSSARLEEMDGPDRRVVIVCDEGYASSLAAAGLRQLGLRDVTDLAGGYQAWRRLPLERIG